MRVTKQVMTRRRRVPMRGISKESCMSNSAIFVGWVYSPTIAPTNQTQTVGEYTHPTLNDWHYFCTRLN